MKAAANRAISNHGEMLQDFRPLRMVDRRCRNKQTPFPVRPPLRHKPQPGDNVSGITVIGDDALDGREGEGSILGMSDPGGEIGAAAQVHSTDCDARVPCTGLVAMSKGTSALRFAHDRVAMSQTSYLVVCV